MSASALLWLVRKKAVFLYGLAKNWIWYGKRPFFCTDWQKSTVGTEKGRFSVRIGGSSWESMRNRKNLPQKNKKSLPQKKQEKPPAKKRKTSRKNQENPPAPPPAKNSRKNLQQSPGKAMPGSKFWLYLYAFKLINLTRKINRQKVTFYHYGKRRHNNDRECECSQTQGASGNNRQD